MEKLKEQHDPELLPAPLHAEIIEEAKRMLADLPADLTFEQKMVLLEQRLIEAGIELDAQKKAVLRAILVTYGRIQQL